MTQEADADRLDRRTVLRLGALAAAGSLASVRAHGATEQAPLPASSSGATDLVELGVDDLTSAMSSGRLTSRSIVEGLLGRIEAVDVNGPAIRSVLEVNTDALAIADELDAERGRGRLRGPLHGIPVLIKDNIDTADRMTTTAGSWALAGTVAMQDSAVAARLREAGAVILGKTNLSEWANFRSRMSTSGWSGRGGQTSNPYALDRSPCGSSSGSGAAVAASLAPLAVGTETNGSIICPSSANSVVGIKPTVGLVGRSGIVPISASQDTAGPMARSVRDAALLLGALAGPDPSDAISHQAAEKGHRDYSQFLIADGLRGARLGIARNYFGFHPAVDALMGEAISAFEASGAELVDPVELDTRSIRDAQWELLLYEFKDGLNRYLARRGPDTHIRSLEQLIAFNEANRDREMPFFGQDIFEKAQAKGDLTEPEYVEAREACLRGTREEGIDALMDEHQLDAVVAPSGGPPWTIDLVNGDHFGGGSSSAAAVSGYPNITVPAGYVFGLPVGISFFGRAFSEPVLLQLAFGYEQRTQQRRPPRYLATAELG